MTQIQDIKLSRSTESVHQNEEEANLVATTSHSKISLANEPSAEMASSNNFAAVTQTLSKQLEDLARKNLADSVVEMHFVNANYRSTSDSSELNWSDSETSLTANECDRRYGEIKQWHSNLFYYKRSDDVIAMNRRAQLKFVPLKPFVYR